MGQAHFTKLHGKVYIKDRTSPTKLDFANKGLEVGDFKVDGLNAENAEIVAVYARGAFQGLEKGQTKQLALSWTYNVKRETLHHASSERAADAILKTGAFSAGTTANPATEVWTVDITYELTDGTTTTTMVFYEVHCEFGVSDGDVLSMPVSGTCYGGFALDPA